MDAFQASFINEATELLQDLEQALLALEDNKEDTNGVAEVFRVMHSLKGTANMFGFDKIGEFTHDLENIYDLIRGGKLKLNTKIFDVTLQGLDHIRNLLTDPKLTNANLASTHKALMNTIKALISDIHGGEGASTENTEEQSSQAESIKTYFVKVIPNIDFFKDGTNPLFLIEDLLALGEAHVFASIKKFDLADYDPENCYVSWQVILATKENPDEINDVFIFVEDTCVVETECIAQENILLKDDVKSLLADAKKKKLFDIATLKALLKAENEKKEQEANANKKTVKVAQSIRVDSDKIDDLMKLVSQLVTTQASLALYVEENKDERLSYISENIDKLTRLLRDNAFGMSLIPIETMVVRFRRLVRDISNSLGKKIHFVTEGMDTELDKAIIENLTDPLMHILRNSLDHGIELPADRKKSGKDETGTLKLSAYYEGTFVCIEVKDDGKGINPDIIFKKAVEKGIISADAKMSKKEILELIFAPGFSTAEQITDVSGRGVGMDVVRRNIADLRGIIDMDSEIGKGTTLILKLPLTLSIIDGLLVKVEDADYVIPVAAIDKCYEIEYVDIIKNQTHKLLNLDNAQVPFFNLREEFNMPTTQHQQVHGIVVKSEGKKVCLIVDQIKGEFQAVLKPLGKYYKDLQLISGSTILGDGSVALVIDPNRIISTFVKHEAH